LDNVLKSVSRWLKLGLDGSPRSQSRAHLEFDEFLRIM
jgi:hypothetical protein